MKGDMKLYYFVTIPNYPYSAKIDGSKTVCAEVRRKDADSIATLYQNALGAGWKVHAMTQAEARDYVACKTWPCWNDEAYTPNEFYQLRSIAPVPKPC